jgi:hypothetical protein
VSTLALFPQGFGYDDGAGDIVLDHVLPFMRGAEKPHLIAVGLDDLLFVEGWATTIEPTRRPASAIYINIDDVATISAAIGGERPDVSSVHGPDALLCGFKGIVPLRHRAPGWHALSASVINSAIGTFRTSGTVRFLVVDPSRRLPGASTVRFDTIAEMDGVDPARVGALSVAYGSRVRIRGQAATDVVQPVASVIVVADNAHVFEAAYGHDGSFEAILGTELLGAGKHRLRAVTLSPDGEPRFESEDALDLDVLTSGI